MAMCSCLTAPDGSLCELYALRPERVSVEADARGWPAAFRYKAGEAVTRLGANELIHIRTHHPLDDHYGLGCLGAASGAIAIHNASAKWNKALLDNAARPSGALVHEAAEPLSGEQFDRLKDELREQFSGNANAGRPMLLEGGLKWQALSMSPSDMDFAGLKAAAAREIALAFGVPPMLLGLPGDATYANYREANKALWRQAILPLAGKILDALSEGLRPWFADLTLKVDAEQVAALSEDRERLWAQVSAADFLGPEEKRADAGDCTVTGEAELKLLLEKASETGAHRALTHLGLADESAAKDMADLRELLSAWRDAKRSARKAVVEWLVRGVLALLVIALAVKLGLGGLVVK